MIQKELTLDSKPLSWFSCGIPLIIIIWSHFYRIINSMCVVLSDNTISGLNSRIYENKWITFFNLYAFKPPTHPLFILKIKYECLVLTSASSLGGSYCTLSFSPPFDVSRMIIWKPSVALLIVASKHKHHLEYDKFRAL